MISAGTIERIRKAIKVNICNPLVPVSTAERKLTKAIKDFAIENSDMVPDREKAASGIRYCHQYKFVMYQHFITTNPNNLFCSLITFYRLWPKNIKRPKLADSNR